MLRVAKCDVDLALSSLAGLQVTSIDLATHDAPASITLGSTITITFAIEDFDEQPRTDSGGVLLLSIDAVDVPLTITAGVATLTIELHASATIKQQPPYFCEARMEPFVIEVTS